MSLFLDMGTSSLFLLLVVSAEALMRIAGRAARLDYCYLVRKATAFLSVIGAIRCTLIEACVSSSKFCSM